MKPYYEHAGITIYHANCLEALEGIGRVDHVITDPPYEAEAHTKGRRIRDKQRNGKRSVGYVPLDFAAMSDEERASVSSRLVSACSGWLLTFCQAEAVAAWRRAHVDAGAKYMRAMVWIKPDGAPQFTGDRPGMGYESIVASWCGSSRSRWNGGGRHGVFTYAQRDNNRPKSHLTQKPIRLMESLVALFSLEGETILDPYMGSGTTLRAAKNLGRKAIGIELEERHCETAARRLGQEVFTFDEVTA